MSFSYLPMPILTTVVIVFSVIVFRYVVRCFITKEKMIGAAGSWLLALVGLLTVTMKNIEAYFPGFEQFSGIPLGVLVTLLTVGSIVIFVEAWKNTRDNPAIRKGLIIIISSMIIIILLATIIILTV